MMAWRTENGLVHVHGSKVHFGYQKENFMAVNINDTSQESV